MASSSIADFVLQIRKVWASGEATEHSYRPAIQALIERIGGVEALNEPRRVKVGAPDFIVRRNEIVVGHIEAKDPSVDIDNLRGRDKEQFDRYRSAFSNLAYTNCLDWRFYRNGRRVASGAVAGIKMGQLSPLRGQFEKMDRLLQDFASQSPLSITSPRDLAGRMAGKAKLVKDILANTLAEDGGDEGAVLSSQYAAFKEHLINGLAPNDFADIYAETIAYGMFMVMQRQAASGISFGDHG